jgi:hypothetical protein
MKKIRRINLFGSAGCGKSITATNVRAQLGFKGYNIEMVEEVIKDWTYIPRIPKDCDCLFLFSSQMQKEDIRLRAGVNLIVSDSPVMLQYFYGYYHKTPMQEAMLSAALEFEQMYPSLSIFIDREDKFYDETGRYEKLSEAKRIDILMRGVLVQNKISFRSFSCLDQDGIIKYVESEINE